MKQFQASDINLLVYDFDGVMTDNRVLVGEDGTEFVSCNRGDGLGINMIKELGIPQHIISTETNKVVATRAKKLGISVMHGVVDKKRTLESFCEKEGFALSRVLYIGNDINDLDAMSIVGFPVCPADSHKKIRELSVLVTQAGGGEGVIREIADLICA